MILQNIYCPQINLITTDNSNVLSFLFNGGPLCQALLAETVENGTKNHLWLKPRMFRTFPNHIDPWILSLEIIDYFGTSKHYWVAGKKRRILISKPALVGCCKLSLYPIACRINCLLISRSNLQASETECCCKGRSCMQKTREGFLQYSRNQAKFYKTTSGNELRGMYQMSKNQEKWKHSDRNENIHCQIHRMWNAEAW